MRHPFIVEGIDEDGTYTPLYEATNSADAIAWMRRYVSRGDAGGWNAIRVVDDRGECAENVATWERPS